LEDLPLGLDSTRPRHDNEAAANREFSDPDNDVRTLVGFSDEVKARELPVPLGVRGHQGKVIDAITANL
jgi:hypothetical protein